MPYPNYPDPQILDAPGSFQSKPGYNSPAEAETALSSAFNPTTQAQKDAIKNAASLVPVSEPSVLTSDKDQDIADYKNRLNNLQTGGMTMDENGVQSYSDGSVKPESLRAQGGTFRGGDGNEYYQYDSSRVQEDVEEGADDPSSENYDPTQNPSYKASEKMISDMKAQFDAVSLANINLVHQQYAQLVEAQKEANRRSEQSRNQSLLMGNITGGAYKYAPLSSEGIMHAQVSYGLSQIADLHVKEQAAVLAAQQAATDNNYKLMGLQLDLAEEARREKQDSMKKIAENLAKENKEIRQKQFDASYRASRDGAITNLMAQGITDPKQLIDMLNYDDKGNMIGDISFKEITEITDKLKEAEKKYPGDVGEWMALKETDPEWKDSQFEDYWSMKHPDEALDRQEQELRIKKLEKEINDNDLGGAVIKDGKIIPKLKDAKAISKDLVTNDAYKSLVKSVDSLQYLKKFEEEFGAYGLQTVPGENRGKVRAAYTTSLLNLKEFFNLGVLNGPDLEVLQGILPDPSTGLFKKFRGRSSATESGIKQMNEMIEKTINQRYDSLVNQFGDYSIESIGGLEDTHRIYVEQMDKLHPELGIAVVVQENPDMTWEEIVQIIR